MKPEPILFDDLPPTIGRACGCGGPPKRRKSTLINRLLGQKVAIVSPKPQTTRNRLLGVLTRRRAGNLSRYAGRTSRNTGSARRW
jgi:hypothetical protein